MAADMQSFFEVDFSATLFPLKTNLLMMRHYPGGMAEHLSRVLSGEDPDRDLTFLAQTKAHAAKPRNHLRRTAVLDPVATYFIYDFVFRNRAAFKGVEKQGRTSFGYRFEDDLPISVHKAFEEFSQAVELSEILYNHSISFDIASYFNSLYHHDLAHWLLGVQGLPSEDAEAMAKFLREANKGRSIDCLPQGIYPAKLIGSAFLNSVESNGQLRCAKMLRFMDDIYLFDNDGEVLVRDFVLLQKLLGQVALNLNPTKTSYDGSIRAVGTELTEISEQLDSIIEDEPRSRYLGSGVDSEWGFSDDEGELYDEEKEEEDKEGEEEDEEIRSLAPDQRDRLFQLLIDPRAEESDVERILSVLLKEAGSLIEAVPVLLRRFPNIVKQLYKVVGLIEDKESLATGISEMLKSDGAQLLEYQLFWTTVIAEDHLSHTATFGTIVMRLYELTSDSEIARAKVLEIPDQSFGLKEIRDGILMTGASNWATWASAMGTRTLPKAARNHSLKYFAKGSSINKLVAGCVISLP